MAIEGFLNALKPAGMTSHDVVAWVRGLVGERRVGHLGTLDPAATGVLPVLVGRATRLFSYAGGRDKAYRAEVVFGTRTDTLDAEGRVVSEGEAGALTEGKLGELLGQFVGEMDQVPPAFSAAKMGGRSLHQWARAGVNVAGRPKRVTIGSLDLVEFRPGREPRALIDVVCSTGTYVRVLADDLGKAAGCGAYLGFLVRTRAGRFALEESWRLEEISEVCRGGRPAGCFLPIDWPLEDLPEVLLEAAGALAFVRGTRVCAGRRKAWPVRVYGPGRAFLGLGEVLGEGMLQPKVVLASEETVTA
ncbi:MAG TPA: tRNA pseudouridine(55) synthase TruB [Armatimonadota bacterium]|nr:tRNA pseudouridine(55) synthase TruB [Armatimonadota bacterium]